MRISWGFGKLESMRMFLRFPLLVFFVLAIASAALPVLAQEGPLENVPPKGVTSEEIITLRRAGKAVQAGPR